MLYRIEQTADKVFIPQVQIQPRENWYIIEKSGLVCFYDTPADRNFCTCTSLVQAEKAIYNFFKKPKFQDTMYPIYHDTTIWKNLH